MFFEVGAELFWPFVQQAVGQIAWRNAPLRRTFHRREAYHRMRRAISYVNSGKFRVKTEAEKQIWSKGSRLIANAMMYHNTLFLSRVSASKKWQQAVVWRKVHPTGNFDFTTSSSPVGIEDLAALHDQRR